MKNGSLAHFMSALLPHIYNSAFVKSEAIQLPHKQKPKSLSRQVIQIFMQTQYFSAKPAAGLMDWMFVELCVQNFVGSNCETKWIVELLNRPVLLLLLCCTSCDAAVSDASYSAGGECSVCVCMCVCVCVCVCVCGGQIGNKMSIATNWSFLNKSCCSVSE